MIVRALAQADVPACLIVIAECWGRSTAHTAEPELRDAFSGGSYRPTFYVAVDDEQVVGIAGYNASWSGYGLFNMCWIGVRPSWRNRGIAAALVNRCLDDLLPVAEAVMLVTHIPRYYAKHWGFVAVSSLPLRGRAEGDTLMVLLLQDTPSPHSTSAETGVFAGDVIDVSRERP